MKRQDFEALGDRQKQFEGIEAGRLLLPGLPVLVRLDGRAFHTFTRGMNKPYDIKMSRAMIETTKYLVEHTHASIGYCQSDEISLVFPPKEQESQVMFQGRVQKLCSVFASMATAKFNQVIANTMPEKAAALPLFDARVWVVPNLETAAEHFLWREADATRNSLSMAAQAHYSTKELHKAGYAKKHELLFAKGINWNDYPAFFKRGTYVRRETVQRNLTESELARIPAKHRPSGPVMRTVVSELDMPPLSKVVNMLSVLFEGAAPQLAEPASAETFEQY